ncbi:TolC family protein [Niabella beijingensis]|uniref:TolC family protein n=1 Tax=Niabella beijingensis TaxID=2872700 RepID=UPI001CBC97F8|nr:TolC family protein [Niabella beijingensis]MBZ4190370.1 TolC family protein [Niabella beijingensis]
MSTFLCRRCCVFAGIWILLTGFHPAAAQQHLSLINLIDSSSAHFPLLKQKAALKKAAEAQLTTTRHSFLPEIKLAEQVNIGTDNSLPGALFGMGIFPSASGGITAGNNLQPATGNIVGLYSEYELFNFGLRHTQVEEGGLNISMHQADFDKDLYQVKSNVVQLYLNLLKYEIRLTTDRQNIDRYSSIRNVIRALSASGLIAGADSSMANAELAKARIGYNQTLGIINQYKEQLSFIAGIPSGNIHIDTSFYSHLHPLLPVINFPLDSIQHPALHYFSTRTQLLQINDQLIRKRYLPRVHLMAGSWARGSSIRYNNRYDPLTTGLGYQRYNYLAGIALTYNLLSEVHKKDQLQENRAALEASYQEFSQERLALQTRARQAANDLHTAAANLTQIPEQLHSAETVYRQKMAQYKAGLISLIDLTNASFVLYRSQIDFTEAHTDWYLALLNKAVATGTLDQFIQSLNLDK